MWIEFIQNFKTPRKTWSNLVKIHVYYDYYLFCKQAPSGIFSNAILLVQFSSVQSLSHVWLFGTPWTAARQASLSIINSQRSLLKLMSIELVMPSNHLILCHPLLLPSIFPSIRVFSNESVVRIRWPKYWSFSFSISPSNEYWISIVGVKGIANE